MHFDGTHQQIQYIFKYLFINSYQFYRKHIAPLINLTFHHQQIRCSERVAVYDMIVIRTPPMQPTMRQLKKMGETALERHHLSAIETSEDCYNLTFVFTDGSRAPPRSTYPSEPFKVIPF